MDAQVRMGWGKEGRTDVSAPVQWNGRTDANLSLGLYRL